MESDRKTITVQCDNGHSGCVCKLQKDLAGVFHVLERVMEDFEKGSPLEDPSPWAEVVLCSGKEIMFNTQTSWVQIPNVPLTVWPWTSYLTSLCPSWVATNAAVPSGFVGMKHGSGVGVGRETSQPCECGLICSHPSPQNASAFSWEADLTKSNIPANNKTHSVFL